MRERKLIKKISNSTEMSRDGVSSGRRNASLKSGSVSDSRSNAASDSRTAESAPKAASLKVRAAPSGGGIDLDHILERLDGCPDIVKKKVLIDKTQEGYFFYVDNFVDKNLMERDFIRPIVAMSLEELKKLPNLENLPCVETEILYDNEAVIHKILAGSGIFVCRGLSHAACCVILEMVQRAIEEPSTEKNIRGGHEGFIEILQINLSILRRRIKNDKLKFKMITLGKQTNQNIAVAYIEDIANMEIVDSLVSKIGNVCIDGLPAIGTLEQIITEHPYSIFPQYLATERPYKAAASLLEGRIVIFLDGTPLVLIAPVSFSSFFQALDDYSTSWIHGSFMRFVRVASMVMAILLPSMYIAITNFHYYVVPLNLLIPLAEARARIPFPPIIEVLFLEALVEIIREAAVRLPTYIGIAASVFASIVIGQAAVEASLVSSVLIVVVGTAAIASYVTPVFDMSMAIRILRFAFTIAASVFGIIGIVVMTGLTLVHLTSMESLGQPYFQPFAPLVLKDLKDTVLRLPYKTMQKRPAISKTGNKNRGGSDAGK